MIRSHRNTVMGKKQKPFIVQEETEQRCQSCTRRCLAQGHCDSGELWDFTFISSRFIYTNSLEVFSYFFSSQYVSKRLYTRYYQVTYLLS